MTRSLQARVAGIVAAFAGNGAAFAGIVVFLLGGAVATSASAHEMTMAELQLRETAPGRFATAWTSSERRPAVDDLRPVWPASCADADNVLRCGPAGLDGELRIDGVGDRYSAALVRITWLDGQQRVHTLTAAQPAVRLYGAADDRRGGGAVASAYLVLGVEHILGGIDHLLFVVGLLFLVGFERRLFWTVTAFTAAHSLTLASAALSWLVLRPAPVEACIALSIVLVAAEALRRRDTWARRWPALVAFLFGLVHGLGFAGALQAIGLPQQHLAIALVTFNVGVELGQLLAIGAGWLVWRVVRGRSLAPQWRTAALYGIGSVAAAWSLQRIVAIGS